LYVDEFQNFATDSFATILSEARKYGLNLTVANQYINQMSDTVRDAVFGNVGTMIAFRISADDAPILAKQFAPQFEPNDLLQMHNRNFIVNMVIKGEKAPAFNATTLTLPEPQTDNTGRIIENTRRNYSRNRSEIEKEIAETIKPPENLQKQPVSRAQAIKWPIGIQPVSFDNNNPTAQSADQTNPAPKKRRRPRRKKKNPNSDNNTNPNQTSPTGPTDAPQAPIEPVEPHAPADDSSLQINH
jgi:hypothetical protein